MDEKGLVFNTLKYIRLFVWFSLLALSLLSACGAPHATGLTSPSESPPSGTVITQSSLAGINGQVASGTVTVYRQSPTDFVLRFASLSLPSETGLQYVLRVDSLDRVAVSLRARTGSQNYTITFTSPPTFFNQVRIHSTVAGVDYAQADF